MDPTPNTSHAFYRFCDALEGNSSAPADGWGLDHALQAWSFYWMAEGFLCMCSSPPPATVDYVTHRRPTISDM